MHIQSKNGRDLEIVCMIFIHMSIERRAPRLQFDSDGIVPIAQFQHAPANARSWQAKIEKSEQGWTLFCGGRKLSNV
jgi:hypothetical protein